MLLAGPWKTQAIAGEFGISQHEFEHDPVSILSSYYRSRILLGGLPLT